MLEPAGSHGVWSLDDYQLLPFYFGASQLIGALPTAHAMPGADMLGPPRRLPAAHDRITPTAIHDERILTEYADDFLYLACIRFLKQVKSGGTFAEMAPMLNDISRLPSWTKINTGLLKMYQGEVRARCCAHVPRC